MRIALIPTSYSGAIDISDSVQHTIRAMSIACATSVAMFALWDTMKLMPSSAYQRYSLTSSDTAYDPVERAPRLSYGKLQDIMNDVLAEFGQVASDQTIVVTMPAINDPNVPKTQEFNSVLSQVLPLVDTINAQRRDKESSENDEELIQRFADTWMDALEFAKSTGMSGLTDTERRRAQSALNNVMSPVNEHEMIRSLELLESILSRVTYVDEKTGKVNHLDVREVLGRKEFVELVEKKRLAIEA